MSKEEIITKLIPVFRNYGYEGATLSRLSEATGLKKASLYHHFQGGKEQMAAAVLGYVGDWMEENVLVPLQSDKSVRDRIKVMSERIDDFYDSGKTPCVLAVMSQGEADNLFNKQLVECLAMWLNALSKMLEETGVEPKQARQRAEDAIIMIQGSLVLVRVNKNPKPFKRIISILPDILLGE